MDIASQLCPGLGAALKWSVNTRHLLIWRATGTCAPFVGVSFVRLCDLNTLFMVSDPEPHTGLTAHTQFYGRLTSSPWFICSPSLVLAPVASLLDVASSNLLSTCTMTYYGDNASQLAGSVIALAIIAYVVFGLRVYTRMRNGSFGVDDWCMVVATVSLRKSQVDLVEDADEPGTFYSIDNFMHRRCIQWHRHPPVQVKRAREKKWHAGKCLRTHINDR